MLLPYLSFCLSRCSGLSVTIKEKVGNKNRVATKLENLEKNQEELPCYLGNFQNARKVTYFGAE